MAWRPSRAVLCTSTSLCLLVSGKACNLPRLLTGCSRTVGMMLPPMEKWMSQMVPRTREILRLFFGLAFIRAHVKRSWKWSSSSCVPTLDWTSVVTSSMNALDGGKAHPLLVSSPLVVSVVPRRISSMHMTNSKGETTQPIMMPTPNACQPVVLLVVVKRMKTFPKYCIKMSATFSGMWKNFNANLMQSCGTDP